MTNDDWVNEVAELRRRVEAERVEIVEADGNVRLVISNSARAPDPVCDGQTFKRDGPPPAGLFF